MPLCFRLELLLPGAFDGLTAYDTYRARLKADPEARENFDFAQAERIILREERTFLENVETA